MLKPVYPAAVVAGNVETSQYVTDTLYGAMGVLAAAQGTMNNFTFGNEKYQYYETICGGSGAGPDFDGCDAVVHTHMTNAKLTDPEVLGMAISSKIWRVFQFDMEAVEKANIRAEMETVRKVSFSGTDDCSDSVRSQKSATVWFSWRCPRSNR